MGDLFDLPSNSFRKRLLKAYDESKHQRDEKGRWTAGGIARTAAVAGAGLAGAAALGVPGARSILPGIRRAVIGARTRAAQRATTLGAVSARGRNMPPVEAANAALYGVAGTGGRSKPAVDITRYQLGHISSATQRRMARTSARSGFNRPRFS